MKQHLFFLLIAILYITTICAQTTVLSVQINYYKSDTIKFVLQRNVIARQFETHLISVTDGKFSDTFHLTQPTYFYTNDGSNYVSGLLEPNDNITISYDAENMKASLKVRGKGSEKTSFVNSLVQLKLFRRLTEQVPVATANKYPFDYLFHYSDSIGNTLFSKLDSIKPFMKMESYDLLRADITATVMGNRYRSVGLIHHETISETLRKRKSELTNASVLYLQHILSFDKTMFYSPSYLNEVYNILSLDYDGLILSSQMEPDVTKKYDYLHSRLPSTLCIPVLTLFLSHDIDNLRQTANIESIRTVIQRTYQNQKDSVYKNYIKGRFEDAVSFKKGMDAPDFVLQDEDGNAVSLSSFTGKVIYLDFWYAACGPCHVLFQTLEPIKKYYLNSKDVVFLCVSIDPKVVWKKALKQYHIEGYHVFTQDKGENHPVIKAYKVAGYPATYLVDKNGKIFMANPSNDPELLQKEMEDALAVENN